MVCKYLAEEIFFGCGSWPRCRVGNTSCWIFCLGVCLLRFSVEREHASGLEVMEAGAAAPVGEWRYAVGGGVQLLLGPSRILPCGLAKHC